MNFYFILQGFLSCKNCEDQLTFRHSGTIAAGELDISLWELNKGEGIRTELRPAKLTDCAGRHETA